MKALQTNLQEALIFSDNEQQKAKQAAFFAEVNLTGDEFQKSPDTFFDAYKVKGKNPERRVAYVLDHIGSTKDEDLYKLLPDFLGRH